MQDAARGEPIARRAARSNVWDRIGAETLEGLLRPQVLFRQGLWAEPAEAERNSGALVGLVVRRRVCEARERRLGEIPASACVANPRRVKPKGASSECRVKSPVVARDSRKG